MPPVFKAKTDMREIKFRVWDKKNQYWQAVDQLRDFGWFGETALAHPEQFDAMQYIGLKDKNDKDVYDGDIYRNLDNGLIGKLVFEPTVGGDTLYCFEYKDGGLYNHHPFLKHDTTNFEVIGNIYETPELLAKQE